MSGRTIIPVAPCWGFGAIQACFGHESQMDKLAAALGMDPLQLRLMNALETGDRLPTGQKVHVPAPVRECLEAAAAVPLPGETGDNVAGYGLPGGAGRTADRSRIRRGIGFAVATRISLTPRDMTMTRVCDAVSNAAS